MNGLFPADTLRLAAVILEKCRKRGLKLATAESCTGGMISSCFTEIPGSSDVFDRGFATYSNAAKHEMLGVDLGLINTHGAVSEPVVQSMAKGAIEHSRAGISVAVTGVAGPGGGTANKPVGLVHIAVSSNFNQLTRHQACHFTGTRSEIRQQTVTWALVLLNDALDQDPDR